MSSEPTFDSTRTKAPSRNPLRRLYAWILSWADKKSGPAILAAIGVAESSVFPVPPDPLLMALCLGKPECSLRFATILSIASVIGGIIGYGIGAFLWDTWGDWLMANVPGFSPEGFAKVSNLYNTYDFWAVFAAGFSPLPYKLFTIAGGVFKISFPVFVIASVISRSARFFLIAVLLKRFGAPIEAFIERHFGWLSLAFVVLLVGGFLLFK
ncbi:MAG: YqaA family protein [Candidatus Zixiibacteriota bacterium]